MDAFKVQLVCKKTYSMDALMYLEVTFMLFVFVAKTPHLNLKGTVEVKVQYNNGTLTCTVPFKNMNENQLIIFVC